MENKNGYIKNSRNIWKLSRLAKVNNLESYSVDWPFWSSMGWESGVFENNHNESRIVGGTVSIDIRQRSFLCSRVVQVQGKLFL
jgi:hypothetical protein